MCVAPTYGTAAKPSQQAGAQCLTQSLGKGGSSGSEAKTLDHCSTRFCCESINAVREGGDLVLLEAKAMTLV